MQFSFAQEKTITGVVSDATGPLPGVNVVVKGTTKGVSTGFDGSYSIKAKEGETLVFSFMGMNEVSKIVGPSNVINTTLQDETNKLQEVVVTALGVSREKKSLGYGTQKIDGNEVSRAPSANFVNALSGKVSGLQIKNNNNIGGSTNVVIRGVKSVTGNNQALFVIDGVPVDNSNTNSANQQTGLIGYDYGNAASDINPNDIETINVLKGAAATALYGSRAANGAIMITTKKGKNQKGIGVTLDSSVSIGFVDSSTFVDYQTQYGQGYFPSFRTAFDASGDGIPDLVVRTNHDASFGPAYDSSISVYGWDSFIPESEYYQTARPWEIAKNGAETFFENPVSTSNTVSFNGGSDKGLFAFSYTNLQTTGLLPNSKQNKNSFLGNASLKLNDKLTASFMGNYINTKTLGRNGTGYLGNIVSNFRQWWATNVDIKEQRDIYFKTKRNDTWNANNPNNLSPAYWNNPYFERYENYQNDSRNRFIGNTALNYKVNDWLDIFGRISVDTYSEFQEERRALSSYSGDPFGIAQTNDPAGYQRFNRNFSEFNYDLMLNFNKNLTTNLNLKGIIGTNIRRTNISSILASTAGGLIVPGLYSLQNSLNNVAKPVEFEGKQGVNGVFISSSLGYKETYFLEGSYRRDVSSTLPEADRAYYYPSLSSSIVFSNLINKNWLSFGKVRAGYAEVGNDARFAILKDTYVAINPFSTPLYSVPNVRNNPNLKSELTKSWEAGLEMQFLDKRLGFDISAYKTNTINQIVNIPVSESTGYTQLFKNVGNIENKGIEATINITPIKNDNFKWDITTNWSLNRNKVIALDEGIENYQLGAFQGGVSINATVGKPYGTIQGTDYVYLNGQRVIDDTTGKYVITSTNDNVLGNSTPDWIGGINNRISYKDFSLSFLIDVQKGGDVFSLDRWYGEGTGIYSNTVFTNDLGNPVRNDVSDGGGVILPGVFADGTPNNIRLDTSTGADGYFGYLGSANSDYVYDASYVKLREVTFNYNLPKKYLGKTLQEVNFGLTGTNLWIIHKNLPDADPEAGLSSGNLQGFQSGVLPTTRNFAFNLKVKF
jgi:TonB-linked SusC/RagA family outer membrane protein